MQRTNTLKSPLGRIFKAAVSTSALATVAALAPAPAHADGEEAVAVLLGVAALYAAYEAGDDRSRHRVEHVHYDHHRQPPHYYREKHHHKKKHHWHEERHKHKHCKHHRNDYHHGHAYYDDHRDNHWRYRERDD